MEKPIIKTSEINEIQQNIICHEQGDELLHYAFTECQGIAHRNTKDLTCSEYMQTKDITDYMTIYDLISVYTKAKCSWKVIAKAFEIIGYEVYDNLTERKE